MDNIAETVGEGLGALGSVGGVIGLGGGTSASCLTAGLAAIGGGSMLAGIAVAGAIPVVAGKVVDGICSLFDY